MSRSAATSNSPVFSLCASGYFSGEVRGSNILQVRLILIRLTASRPANVKRMGFCREQMAPFRQPSTEVRFFAVIPRARGPRYRGVRSLFRVRSGSSHPAEVAHAAFTTGALWNCALRRKARPRGAPTRFNGRREGRLFGIRPAE